MTSPLILGFDTSGPHCAAALVRGPQVLATQAEAMAKGQAERLMDLLEEVLASQDVRWQDLSAIAVGVGPGNFTGIRIGVSAARGLALGLGIPAYGVTGFEARQRMAPPGTTVAIPAPRGMAYVMAGDQAQTIAFDGIDNVAPEPAPSALAQAVAAHAIAQWPATPPAPAPYYVRPPDAAPARDAAPTLLP
mmetsp:Transcript_27398/g.50364  ORF Transcript_27398/g.50364 Transcript_27398/m.50364 type:complete len:191 (-) Transcript_27398:20-592(-)